MNNPTALALAQRMKAVADPTRLRIIAFLASRPKGRPEARTVDIRTELGKLTQPTISHHLRVLTAAGLVTVRPEGWFVYYRLNREGFEELAGIVVRLPS